MKAFLGTLATIGGVAVVVFVAGVVYIATGSYNVAADSGHGALDKLAEITRERSVESRASQVDVPDLNNAGMVQAGAQTYDHLCKGCHLAPGMADNPTRKGMNPRPPEFTEFKNMSPKEEFWAAKHGIKMTAMPAWDKTQPDKELWKVIAFLQKLPGMSSQQYGSLTSGQTSGGS